jgi:ribosomal 50S subunit-associated protein YjgA (DUF615 family)
MKQFCENALDYAVKKAKTEQQKNELIKNFKDIYKFIYKLEKQDGKHVSSTSK